MVIETSAIPNGGNSDQDDSRAVQELTQERDALKEIEKKLFDKDVDFRKVQEEYEKLYLKHKKSLKSHSGSTGKGKHSEDFETCLKESNSCLKSAEKNIPFSGGFFVEAFFGTLDVRFQSRKNSLTFKEEYERFKQKLAPFFVIGSILCIIFKEQIWLHVSLQFLLAYYYVAMALRENILRRNGSNIKAWWIWHHYLTIAVAAVLLTWPSSESYFMICTKIHGYGLYVAVLQIFQTRYQIARLYTLRSLGKAGDLDVSNSDSTQIHWSESMKLLLPLLIIGQIIQCYVSISILRVFYLYPTTSQALVAGLMFFSMFLGNATTTIMILRGKYLKSKKKTS